MTSNTCFLYQIRHVKSGKRYIGSAVKLKPRWNKHKRDLINGVHHSPKLQRAWDKYGEHSFVFEVIELVGFRERLLEREQFWMDTKRPFFNVAPIAGSMLGYKHTSSMRAKCSALMKERMATAEMKAKMQSVLKGRVFSAETIEKMKAAAKKRVSDPAVRAKISESLSGRKADPAAVEKRAAALRGKARSAETREKIAAGHRRAAAQRAQAVEVHHEAQVEAIPTAGAAG